MKRLKAFYILFLFLYIFTIQSVVHFIKDIQPIKRLKTDKIALIFGITGQDGIYLSQFLLNKGYTVYGVVKGNSSKNTKRFASFFQENNEPVYCMYADISELNSVFKIVATIQPDEIYNLAAQSMVKASFEYPIETAKINGLGTLYILEAIRKAGLEKKVKFYQASSGEMFGSVKNYLQNEDGPFHPRSPYGVSKLFAYWMCVNYREAYDIFICNGILFNHESPYRGEEFVTRSIAHKVAKIKLGLADHMKIGNLNAKRDWGYAQDYVKAMWLMMQQNMPGDYIISTGKAHSVREFLETAFKEIDIEIIWKGEGLNEVGYDKKTGNVFVVVDQKLFRPAEIDCLVGDSSKAHESLGWSHSLSFKELVSLMVNYELNLLKEKECL